MTHTTSRTADTMTIRGRKASGAPWRLIARRETPTSIARELGECVYFIRSNDDLVKIGHTTNLAKRKGSFAVGWDRVLAVMPGTYDDEQALHREFAEHRARGDEWYHPGPAVLGRINEIRSRLGISPVTAW